MLVCSAEANDSQTLSDKESYKSKEALDSALNQAFNDFKTGATGPLAFPESQDYQKVRQLQVENHHSACANVGYSNGTISKIRLIMGFLRTCAGTEWPPLLMAKKRCHELYKCRYFILAGHECV